MMSFKSSEGISLVEMYSEKILKARSSKLRSRHSVSQPAGSSGTCSGMKRPPSEARPFRTTSSNESYAIQKEKSIG